MKKITLFITLVMCSLAVHSTRYLVQLGTEGAATWRAAGEGETLIDLTVETKDFDSWYGGVTFNSGDEIWMTAGTYVNNAQVLIKNGVSIYGSFAGTETTPAERAKAGTDPWDFAAKTVIDGNNGNYYGLNGSTVATVETIIDGITVTRFQRTGTGGGCGVVLQGTSIMRNCIVSYNTLLPTNANNQNSAGVFLRTGTQLIDSHIHHNAAGPNGANIASGGGISIAGQALVKGCLIENNSASYNAGAIAFQSQTASHSGGGTVEDCIIRNNTAAQGGGAMFQTLTQAASAGAGTLLIKNCEIYDNTSGQAGGAINLTGQSGSTTHTVSIEGCTFASNTATTGNAGAIRIGENVSTLNYIKNCIFRDNATADGIGEGSAVVIEKPTTISNCVIVNNSGVSALYATKADTKVFNCTFANNNGIAFKMNAVTGCEAKNNIFWNNTDNTITGGDAPVLAYNAYSGTAGADAGAGTITSLSVSPNNTFRIPTTFIGKASNESQLNESEAADWNLSAASPAINAGTDLTSAGIIQDITGTSRPFGGVFDLGAYEYTTTTNLETTGKEKVYQIVAISKGIGISALKSGQKVTLYNLTGQVVRTQLLTDLYNEITNVPSGIYLIQIEGYLFKTIVP